MIVWDKYDTNIMISACYCRDNGKDHYKISVVKSLSGVSSFPHRWELWQATGFIEDLVDKVTIKFISFDIVEYQIKFGFTKIKIPCINYFQM